MNDLDEACEYPKVTIERVCNGYVVTTPEERLVYGGDEVSLTDSLAEAMRQLPDVVGVPVGRHSDKRIYVIVHKGDKHPEFNDALWDFIGSE